MTWLLLTIASAFLLGFYDYFKKVALRGNAVLPVLFGSVAAGALVWLPLIILSAVAPDSLPSRVFFVTGISYHDHLLLFAKAALVGASWLLGYYGIQSLPLSIASPIRATGPLWTIGFAVAIFHESPSPKQWLGVAVILTSFFAFTFVGRNEGIHFHRNKGVFFMIGATLLGATSSLYDKFLLQKAHLTPCQVQAWFTIYTTLILIPPLALWLRLRNRKPFHWHWAIAAIGLTLLVADILFFSAIAQPNALISLIAPVRRASVIVSFLLGIFLFGEKQLRPKGICIAGIIAGLILLS
ncbi:MAG: EamA family transporter [Gloeobacteraceae cyanobacterium ES-bin-144]|nr:EamA family transporter [Verrucomicrobiales bacterium]